MNCKQGDLAIIVKGSHGIRGACSCLIGLIVKVGPRCDSWSGIGWSIDLIKCKTSELIITSCADSCMKPIPPEKDVLEHDQIKELETV